MAINDLLNGIKRTVVRGALGLALLAPVAYGCGDTGDEMTICESACEYQLDNCCSGSDDCYTSVSACVNDCNNWPVIVVDCMQDACVNYCKTLAK